MSDKVYTLVSNEVYSLMSDEVCILPNKVHFAVNHTVYCSIKGPGYGCPMKYTLRYNRYNRLDRLASASFRQGMPL